MSAVLHSRIFEGKVRHRRAADVAHSFEYGIWMIGLDLSEEDRLPEFLTRAGGRFAPLSYRRSDYLPHPKYGLRRAIEEEILRRYGERPSGRILMLTQLRGFGYLFNPVSFFLVFDEESKEPSSLRFILAEIHNTPWGERHVEVLDARAQSARAVQSFRFKKSFHVSPFQPLEQTLCWQFRIREDRVLIAMQNEQAGKRVFDATLHGRLHPLTREKLARLAWRRPMQSFRLHFAIYWHALKLIAKGARFHPHPKRRSASTSASVKQERRT